MVEGCPFWQLSTVNLECVKAPRPSAGAAMDLCCRESVIKVEFARRFFGNGWL